MTTRQVEMDEAKMGRISMCTAVTHAHRRKQATLKGDQKTEAHCSKKMKLMKVGKILTPFHSVV